MIVVHKRELKMYSNQILVNFFFFVAVPSISLIFAATNNTLTSSKEDQTIVNGTKTGDAISSADKGIATRFGVAGSGYTIQVGCQCMARNSCPSENIDTNIACLDSSHICCESSLVRDAIPNQNCTCTKKSECLEFDPEPIKSISGVIEPKFAKCKESKVCCSSDKVQNLQSPPSHTTSPPYAEISNSNSQQTDSLNANPVNCGMRNSIERRMSGDTSTLPEEFPWMVLILKMESAPDGTLTDKRLLCGGSLISSKIVLTAAHCVIQYQNNYTNTIKVRAGEYDTRPDFREAKIHQDRAVDKISIHENFIHSTKFYNDMALIRVTEDFIYDPHVSPICVPLTQSWYSEPNIYDPTKCVATGWGKYNFYDSHYSNTLKKAELSIFSNSECQNELRKERFGSGFELHSSFICAKGSSGSDTCTGDGGGPLICALRNHSSKYVQVGIVSWGSGCGGNTPGVYASLEANQNWLTSEFNILTFL